MVVDGKAIAGEIVQKIGDSLKGATLAIVATVGNAATDSYVRIKSRLGAQLGVEVLHFAPDQFAQALRCDGVIVQLPMPRAETLLNRLPPEKDIDALGERPLVISPVAAALGEILARAGVAAARKKAVVIGEGRLVGAPVAALLREVGANVVVVTLEQGSLNELHDADIVVSGAGSPSLIKPEMLKQGVVLIDAGTSEADNRVVGDCDPRCESVASVFTPVPGGVGPIAVAMLYKNLLDLKKRNPGR